ncbi:hypothetical protein IAQ61_000976 [Plenodomus lingam]|uniref:uncharacterized protein n=1 Tax=Leptosphaeria maculans TaxID=5022 RepID=UPI0033206F45|nr:hypothetical protein IAQ61_000976 [Plenodomus lingam]
MIAIIGQKASRTARSFWSMPLYCPVRTAKRRIAGFWKDENASPTDADPMYSTAHSGGVWTDLRQLCQSGGLMRFVEYQ